MIVPLVRSPTTSLLELFKAAMSLSLVLKRATLTTWEGLLGEEFTGDVANSWQTLLDYVVAVMVEGNRVYVEEERRCNLVTTPEVNEVEDCLSLRTDVQLDSDDMVMDSIEIANIGAIVTDIMEQMNLSKPEEDSEDYFKSIGLRDETRVTVLFRKFNKSDHDLNQAYLLPLSSKDLTFEETTQMCEVFDDNTFFSIGVIKCLNLAVREDEDIHKYKDKNPDVMLHKLVDEYNNFRSLTAYLSMIENRETGACLIKKA
ncbi:hypothetical protein ACTXT7_002058 [Hymenolepis weldensis]